MHQGRMRTGNGSLAASAVVVPATDEVFVRAVEEGCRRGGA